MTNGPILEPVPDASGDPHPSSSVSPATLSEPEPVTGPTHPAAGDTPAIPEPGGKNPTEDTTPRRGAGVLEEETKKRPPKAEKETKKPEGE